MSCFLIIPNIPIPTSHIINSLIHRVSFLSNVTTTKLKDAIKMVGELQMFYLSERTLAHAFVIYHYRW